MNLVIHRPIQMIGCGVRGAMPTLTIIKELSAELADKNEQAVGTSKITRSVTRATLIFRSPAHTNALEKNPGSTESRRRSARLRDLVKSEEFKLSGCSCPRGCRLEYKTRLSSSPTQSYLVHLTRQLAAKPVLEIAPQQI
ncbi:hypothetical protein PGT21_026718 [Puccinia graminis f. sp. tritici]|uniref:Uncharacterized protein n=1 Tax=Puccinia graminis f. sp. tritici TaxID=56615 RepID=A0A5B0NMB8_PUCGR|nr:hypothetical protein PGT21_026718 [Puccinia graminis f. sp. tritici]